jgi:hypothetical protein
MSHFNNENSVAYGVTDKTVIRGFEIYKNENFAKLHKHFYTFMLHGEEDGVYIYSNTKWTANEFVPLLKSWYQNAGQGRAILLVSCWVGWKFAGELAIAANLPVVAAKSAVSFGYTISKGKNTSCIIAQNEMGIRNYFELTNQKTRKIPRFREEWIFFHPTGKWQIIPGRGILNQDQAVKKAKEYVQV